MSDLRELYQEVILDHYRHPRNRGHIDRANHEALGHNPLCGDRIKIFVEVEGGVVRDVSFEGSGCAISTASASLMTEAIKGRSVKEAEALFRGFHDMLVEEKKPPTPLEKLEVLAGVRDYPIRVKCATLAWHTLHAALSGEGEATTE